jgi:NitT/TauT family transport system ATP-binding protein
VGSSRDHVGQPAPSIDGVNDGLPLLEVVELGKAFGGGQGATAAIDRVSFAVEEHEFVCVVGPSGCGKTTLLKCISGLLRPSAGKTLLRGRPVDGPPPEMAVVFQDYSRSLFSWLTVRKNVLLPLRHRRQIRDRDRIVSESLAAVGLSSFANHYPWQLSGGMQQRVAIARALAYQPRVLLMDEPFASVDAQTRADLQDLVLSVARAFGVTMLLVTHDIDESVYMGDRVIILTPRPCTVRDSLSIDLPRPRDQVATKSLPEFARLRGHVYREIAAAAAGLSPSPV